MLKYLFCFLILCASGIAEELHPPLLTIGTEYSDGNIKLSDGTQLWIPFLERSTVKQWKLGDPVELSGLYFKTLLTVINIRNTRSNESAGVLLSAIPEATNESIWVYAFDRETGEVTLNNGWSFTVLPKSAIFGLVNHSVSRLLRDWKVGDIILVLKDEENASYELYNATLGLFTVKVKAFAPLMSP